MDIVERLTCRNVPYGWPELAEKAAAEIVDARAQIEHQGKIIAKLNDQLSKAVAELRYRKDNPLHCAAARPGEATYECGSPICEPCRIRVENERLRAALLPFVHYIVKRDLNEVTAGYPDTCPLAYYPDDRNDDAPTVGDLREARRAYELGDDQHDRD